MFGVDFYEILVIALVAFFALDSKDVPRLLYKLGKFVARLRKGVLSLEEHGRALMEDQGLEEYKEEALEKVRRHDKPTP